MTLVEWFSLAKDLAKEYGSVASVLVGLLAVPFGGKLFYDLVKRRISHLESELEAAQERIHELDETLSTRTKTFVETKGRLEGAEAKLQRAQAAFDDNSQVWFRQPVEKPEWYNRNLPASIPILVVANLKGGVGKTTIAANLLAYFEREKKERVLAIDLDYQGSLSSMLLAEPKNREERSAQAVKAIIGGASTAGLVPDSNFIIANSSPVRGAKNDSRIIDCDDPFANFETRILLQWLIGDIGHDIRYNLARVLHGREIQDSFDRVIIDAPPRITAGFINALCASTHLIVPFVLDTLSAERVGLFLRGVRRMKGLFPYLELAGVVGTMKGDNTTVLREGEKRAVEEANRRIMECWGGGQVLDRALIPRKQTIADAAGLRIAYYESSDARSVFEVLGKQIFDRTIRERRHESRVA
jgi:cellulose biosynthesis protein BcsQ